jgi:hypothetical protein
MTAHPYALGELLVDHESAAVGAERISCSNYAIHEPEDPQYTQGDLKGRAFTVLEFADRWWRGSCSFRDHPRSQSE